MKTAYEILADDTIDRRQLEAKERAWAALVRDCRVPRGRMPFLAQMVMSVALIAVFAVTVRQTGDYRGLYLVSGAFLLIALPMHFWQLRKREKALLAMIEQEAPELHRRLKVEKIA
jgi:hypothetical protein